MRRYRPEGLRAVRELHSEGLDAVGARMEGPSLGADLDRILEVYFAGGGASFWSGSPGDGWWRWER